LNREELKHIIDAVTREVMRRLAGEIKAPEERKGDCEPKDKLLLVFTGGTENLDTALSYLRELSNKYTLLAAFSPAAEQVIGREKVRESIEFEEVSADKLHYTIYEAKAIIFPTLTQNTAAKAAVGIRDSLASEAMACGLLLKKDVIAVSDSINILAMPPAYGRMVNEILRRIEQLGVKLCKANELIHLLPNDNRASKETLPQRAAESETKTLVFQEKAPVTADMVLQAALEGYKRISLAPNTIVTPMARDTAKDKNIIIEWAVR